MEWINRITHDYLGWCHPRRGVQLVDGNFCAICDRCGETILWAGAWFHPKELPVPFTPYRQSHAVRERWHRSLKKVLQLLIDVIGGGVMASPKPRGNMRDGKPFRLTLLKGDKVTYRNSNEDCIESLTADGKLSMEHRGALVDLKEHWINASRDSAFEVVDYVDKPIGVGIPSEVLDSLQVLKDLNDILGQEEKRIVFNIVEKDIPPTPEQLTILPDACEKIYNYFSSLT